MENANQASQSERAPRVNMFKQLWVVISTGVILATLFTAWTPLGLLPLGLGAQINDFFSPPGEGDDGVVPLIPTPRPRPRIGIVSGHYGFDSGAICPDGLTEESVNLDIATRVKEYLSDEGFDVDLLEEKDQRLFGYQALALVSIHADSCTFINTEASGYKVAAALASARPNNVARLVACISSRYQTTTGLTFHAGSITEDMTSYHAFDEIHSDTAAAIIETGFLNLDRQILTQQPDLIAEGISKGVLCFIRNEDATLP